MDKKEAILVAKKYVSEIRDFIHQEKAFLFGSYVHGTPSDESDIDIGIFVNSINDDFLITLKKLYKARRSIDIRIEPHLFIAGTDQSGFSEEVEKMGLPL